MNKHAELTRWTPRRLLSLLMALIMTLSLLPTAAFARDGDDGGTGDNADTSGDSKYTLTFAESSLTMAAGQKTDATFTLTGPMEPPNPAYFTVSVATENGEPVEIASDESAPNKAYIVNDGKSPSGNNPSGFPYQLALEFSEPGTYTVEVKLFDTTDSSKELASVSTIVTVVGITSLTVSPADVQVGDQFDVTAETSVSNGYVLFEYGGSKIPVSVTEIPGNAGIASCKFTAVAGNDTVKATLYGGTEMPAGSQHVKTADLNVAGAETTYTVTFDVGVANAGPVPTPQSVQNGGLASEPTAPVRDNYEFDGWYLVETGGTLGKKWDFATDKVEANITLRAQWTPVKVTITWSNSQQGVELFYGNSPVTADQTSTVNQNSLVTFTAKWDKAYEPAAIMANGQPLAPTIGTADANGTVPYTYTFTASTDTTITISQVAKKTFTITLPSVSGCNVTFSNCYRGSEKLTKAEDAMSYTFQYGDTFQIKVEAYPDTNVTLYVDGTNALTVNGNTADNVQTAPGAEQNGYQVDHDYVISVTAKPVVMRTVTFQLDQVGRVYSTQKVENGQTASRPTDPEIPGYSFVNWYSDASLTTPFDFNTVIRKDTIIYGKLNAETYTITFNANPPANKDDSDVTNMPATGGSKTYGGVYQIPDTTPALIGYTFKGWSTSADGAPVYQPGEAYVADMNVTLYAVWERITHTITLSAGEGYSIHHNGSLTVGDGDSFTFRVAVAKGNEQKKPSVYANMTGYPSTNMTDWAQGPSTDAQTGMLVYTYTLPNIKADTAINVVAAHNDVYTVKFVAVKGGTQESDPFLTQRIAWNEYAQQPLAPEREGYTFKGYYEDVGGATKFGFATKQITGDTTIYAIYDAITPVITIVTPSGDGWALGDWKYGTPTGTENKVTEADVVKNQFTIPYGNNVTFKLTVQPGYDYSKLSVSADGYALGYTSITTDPNGVTTIEYYLGGVTKDTRISVSGIERKTITVTYNENALDHVSNLPAPQEANYYLVDNEGNGINNTNFTKTQPIRTGYKFLGWSTNGAITPEAFKASTDTTKNFKVADIEKGLPIPFTENTTVYAIWEAQELSVKLTFSNTAGQGQDAQGNKYDIQYEGKEFTLNAELSARAKGSMIFKMSTKKDGTDAEVIGSVNVSYGDTASLTVPADKYVTPSDQNLKYYWVEFQAEKEEGYTDCESDSITLKIFSRAITWAPLKDGNNGTLTIKDKSGATQTSMIAGQTYTLEVDTNKITGLEALDKDKPTLGNDYYIVWQYKKTSTGDWETVNGNFTDTNQYQVTPEESGYEFRAKVYPKGELYNAAAKFNANNAFVNNEYDDCLYTNTVGSARQATTTELTVTAPTEANNVKINGGTPFTTDLKLPENGTHPAQFEGQTVTLTATVTKKDTTTAVESGSVEFYRYAGKNDENEDIWTLIGKSSVDADGTTVGTATYTYTMSAYDNTKTATDNKEVFKAVYVANATYNTSTSATDEVYIKSAKFQTPVIMDADGHTGKWLNGSTEVENGGSKTETTYTYDLGGLTAGIPHKFTLKTDGAEGTEAYSVVALDGRSVDAANYDIEWQVKNGANFTKAGNDDSAATFNTSTTKVGDRYRVVLTGKGVFAGNSAMSKDIVIGELQGVTVTVKAIDAIKATTETDVYQLNDITLTATVAAAGENPSMKPTGKVAFYYEDATGVYKYLGEATLQPDTNGDKVATITTNELPVTPTANIKRDVTITAVYLGDTTFKASDNWDAEKNEVKTGTYNSIVTDHVTVYSSVVFNCTDENKNRTTSGDKGIHISLSDGTFKAHETATLKLSDIYTLDRELNGDLLDTIAKLNPNKDYTIQWEKLNNATALKPETGETEIDYGKSVNWVPISSEATGTTVRLEIEQDTAYRAVITVKDPATAIVKGSSEQVEQTVKGRQVYYSNILMPTDANMTVSVAINTSVNGTNKEGITEGETVTANVFLSGATNATPNAIISATVTNDSSKGNTVDYTKDLTGNSTVNGWNALTWDTKGVAPGFYTLTVTAKSNTGYADKTITRSLIVRESSYGFTVDNLNPTYNGRTQGVTVELNNFQFNGTAINDAAAKSWTVKYYDKNNNLVEPSQAGEYKAVVTLPGSAYWTEQTKTVDFKIEPREVSIADAIAQAKVYDGTMDVNIVEVMLNDAVTDQSTNGTGLPTDSTGIINSDSIYAVATEAKLDKADVGKNSFTISKIELLGDDAANYKWDEASYTESIYVSRSQVYGETAAVISGTNVSLKLKKGEAFPADKVIKMIDQSGKALEANKAYTLTFYYHSDTEIKQTTDLSKLGLYTVVARPNQDNFKGGVTMKFEVIDGETTYTEAATPQPSTLITIGNTAELYGKATGIDVALTKEGATYSVMYQDGTSWTETRPINAGRYLVKVTASTGDVAYGIYTITKAHPSISITAEDATYNSMPQNGYTTLTGVDGKTANDYYLTYAGDVAIGYNVQKDGNVAEEAPVDAGSYVVTLHVNETDNYTAYEVSAPFTISKAPLTIRADSWTTTQYGAFPDMTATYTGLAAEVGDSTPDTSLRDVQIAPEFVYNPTDGKPNYSNDSLDQVGAVTIQPINALSKNYIITYENGQYTKDSTSDPTLAIHGLPQSSVKDTANNKVITVYYGDVIQLYPYGNYTNWANGSSELTWSVTRDANFKGEVTVDSNGILTVNGVGDFTVKLTRGDGEQAISTSVTVTAIKKEVQIALKDVDKVYNGSEQEYAESNITVHDELYRALGNFGGKVTLAQTKRMNIGTQITTAQVTGAWSSQSRTYGGQFTINDKEATVAPVGDSHTYGEKRTVPTPNAYTVDDSNAISNVLTASQTDDHNRLDVNDGYEILVAGTENMNYNVKYKTDHNDPEKNAEDSKVTEFDGVKFTSKTVNELNDATVYGETPNALDWTLDNAIASTRGGEPYADNLADFDLPTIFVQQDKDDCTGNAKTYKAANRTTDTSDSNNIKYNQAALEADRTATDTAKDENYTLKFTKSVTNSGAANYKLTDNTIGNATTTTDALTADSKGFIKTTEETGNVDGENFIEGSANIAQRPVTVEKKDNTDNTKLYWKLPQKDLYTALLNILKAEKNSTNRGLAKSHTIEDLDLSFTIGTEVIDKNSDQPLTGSYQGSTQVTLTVGDTNYVLDGDGSFNVDFETLRIRAVYYNKTFTGFQVRIEKIDENGNSAGPLTSANGLTFKVLKQTNGVLDTTTDYATNKNFQFVSSDSSYGYFRGTYDQLPLLGNGELYVFQMYEYGVPLDRK